MDFNVSTCFYEQEDGLLFNCVDFKNLKALGFTPALIKGSAQNLLEYMSYNKVDIWVVNIDNIDKDRFLCMFDIVFNHFCKNILLISNKNFECNKKVSLLNLSDLSNFDLRLEMSLMNIKKEIQLQPSRNIDLLRSKIHNMLDSFQFSSRHDGFKYYVDAIILAYMQQPYNYSTMQIYKDVAKMYNKSLFAVEKSMRMALSHAFNKLKNIPITPQNMDLKSHLTYDLNNNTAISMMLSRLMKDEDIVNDLLSAK